MYNNNIYYNIILNYNITFWKKNHYFKHFVEYKYKKS